jgi:hypothetical protein
MPTFVAKTNMPINRESAVGLEHTAVARRDARAELARAFDVERGEGWPPTSKRRRSHAAERPEKR